MKYHERKKKGKAEEEEGVWPVMARSWRMTVVEIESLEVASSRECSVRVNLKEREGLGVVEGVKNLRSDKENRGKDHQSTAQPFSSRNSVHACLSAIFGRRSSFLRGSLVKGSVSERRRCSRMVDRS